MSNLNKIKDFLNKNKKYIFSIISLISIVLIIYIVISNNVKFTSKNDEEIILKDGSIVFYHEIKTNKYKFCYKDDLDNENKCEFISKNGMDAAIASYEFRKKYKDIIPNP